MPAGAGLGRHAEEAHEPERRAVSAVTLALRLGFRQVKGLQEKELMRLVERRGRGYADLPDLRRRAGLSAPALDRLARADAFGSLTLDRRGAIWGAIGLDGIGHEADPPPLFAWAEGQAARPEPVVELPRMTLGQHVAEDYASLHLTLRAHPLALLRGHLGPRVIRASELADTPNGRLVEVAGLALVRQRPGTASGVIFITIEDESGVANLVVWPTVFERFRRVVLAAQLLVVRGKVQKEGLVIHVVAEHLEDRSDLLRRLGETDRVFAAPVARADRVKRPQGGARACQTSSSPGQPAPAPQPSPPGSTRASTAPAATEAAQGVEPRAKPMGDDEETAQPPHPSSPATAPFQVPLAHADHAKSSGGPDPRDLFVRPRDLDHFRPPEKPFAAPLARADEVKRNTRNARELHLKLRGFKSRDFH